ncbi:MAG TPA: hypothetical protein VFK94_05155, partial [Patescibacteria group bacterium]|nr:hypothetical protein [Patescibacteria group bacterium]
MGRATTDILTNKTLRGAPVFDTATATDDTLTLSPFVGGAARFLGTITSADLTAARTYTLPDASGTFAVAGSNAIGLSAAGAISLTISGATADAATTSNSGLVITSTGVSLLRGCNPSQILKWTSPSWACADDNTGAGGSFIAKNAQDTSSASVAGILYDFTNSNTGASAQVLRLTNDGTSNALEVVQSANPASGKALIYANNSNVSPSGSLIDLRAGGASKFSVDAAGSVTIASSQSYLGAGALTLASGGTGTLTLRSSDQTAGSTNSANVTIKSGDASGLTSNSGNISIDAGTATGTKGTISVGGAQASALNLGRSGITTTIAGSVTLSAFGTAGVVHNDATGALSSSLIVNADVSATAAIAYSKLNLATSIVGGDLATNITISTTGNIATTGTGTITSAGLLTGSNGLTISSGTVTLPSTSIADSALSTNVALLTGTQVFTGAKTFTTATATDDSLSFTPFVGGAARFNGAITSLDLTAARTYTFQNDSGIVPLSTAGNTVFFTTSGTTTLTLPTTGTVTALGNTTTGSGSIVLATSPTISSPT